jgi:hypothetical protein
VIAEVLGASRGTGALERLSLFPSSKWFVYAAVLAV